MASISLTLSLRGQLLSSVRADTYGVNTFSPEFVLDFAEEYYRTNNAATTFDSAITHAATTNATMVDSDGLLKWRPHNLLKYSEDFTNGAWLRALANITASPNDPLSGFSTLSRFTTTSVSNPYLLQSGVTVVSGVDYTFEMIVKYVDTQWVRFQNQEAEAVWFDLLNGVVGTQTNATGTIEALSDGFYRVAIEFDANDTSTYLLFTTSQTDGGGLEAIGSVDVQAATAYRSDLGGMVNNPDRGDSYVPTTTAARYLPRLGHHVYNGTSWVNEGLLHESDARTNLVPYSEDTSQWLAVGTAAITNQTQVAPDGTSIATLVDIGATGNGLGPNRVEYSDIGLTAGSKATVSLYLKKPDTDAASHIAVRAFCSGTTTTDPIVDYSTSDFTSVTANAAVDTVHTSQEVGNGWYRVSFTFTLDASGTGEWSLRVGGLISGSYTATGTDFIFWGAQVELGSTPSSYIPTAGATATRAAETLTVPAANMPAYTDAVSIQMDGLMTYADTDTSSTLELNKWSTGTDYILNYLQTDGARTGKIQFAQNKAGVFDSASTTDTYYTPDINVPFNLASRHGSTFVNGAVDGTALTANLTPTALPDLSATNFQLGHKFMGTIGKLRVWADDIGDTGIVEAST